MIALVVWFLLAPTSLSADSHCFEWCPVTPSRGTCCSRWDKTDTLLVNSALILLYGSQYTVCDYPTVSCFYYANTGDLANETVAGSCYGYLVSCSPTSTPVPIPTPTPTPTSPLPRYCCDLQDKNGNPILSNNTVTFPSTGPLIICDYSFVVSCLYFPTNGTKVGGSVTCPDFMHSCTS